MEKLKTLRLSPAALAKLSMSAILFLGLAITTQKSFVSTSSPSGTKTLVAGVAPSEAEDARVARLDRTMAVLSPQDAKLYRTAFAAQKAGDWVGADAALAQVKDKRLTGPVLADRYERRSASKDELIAWLRLYASQPDAPDFYAQVGRKAHPPRATTPTPWSAGYAAEVAPDFMMDLTAGDTPPLTEADRLAQKINEALRRHDPATARDLLIAAQAKAPVSGTFAADAEASIAAGFFYTGEREQAGALATAAATANQPLGLWVQGLMAWERHDYALAASSFGPLADHPALSGANRAAAAFWAARALEQSNLKDEATARLEQAAKVPRSFYGMLAAQKLGRDPLAAFAQPAGEPVWNAEPRAVLTKTSAGWRALALVQVGEAGRAEAELRRLNPAGRASLQRAMLALAHEVPMPALVVQLASLNFATEHFAAAFDPLPPWQPADGFRIDRALLFALARHESHFDPDAESSRGAVGLMQIMPSTVRAVTRTAAEATALAHDDHLFDPAVNLGVGQDYVRHLASRPQIGDNLMLLLAAYNSGPNNLAHWQQSGIQNLAANDPLLFMETIPVPETRHYIARVLPHYWAYRARLAEPLTTLTQLADGAWPTTSVAEVHPAGMFPIRVASWGK